MELYLPVQPKVTVKHALFLVDCNPNGIPSATDSNVDPAQTGTPAPYYVYTI